jgi:hypothetical protein
VPAAIARSIVFARGTPKAAEMLPLSPSSAAEGLHGESECPAPSAHIHQFPPGSVFVP